MHAFVVGACQGESIDNQFASWAVGADLTGEADTNKTDEHPNLARRASERKVCIYGTSRSAKNLMFWKKREGGAASNFRHVIAAGGRDLEDLSRDRWGKKI